MPPPSELEEFTNKLVLLGEEKVREQLLQNVYASKHKKWAEAWIDSEEKKRTSDLAMRTEDREEKALSIARDANKIARSARTISLVAALAAIVAAIAAVIAVKW